MQIEPSDIESLQRQFATLENQVALLLRSVEGAQRLGAIGVLAAAVAHEVNNILTPMHGYARSALARPGDVALTQKALELAASGSERAAGIARSILALAGGAAAEQVGPAPTVVGEAVREAIEVSRFATEAARVRIVVDVGDGVATSLECSSFVQIVHNLLLNAARAMRGGGGVIRIAARDVPNTIRTPERAALGDVGGGWVEVLVADDGPGIPEEVRARLFKPFAAAGVSGRTTTGVGGNGLGLSICKTLVEAAGGSIEVETAVGEGTTFRLLLPAAPIRDGPRAA